MSDEEIFHKIRGVDQHMAGIAEKTKNFNYGRFRNKAMTTTTGFEDFLLFTVRKVQLKEKPLNFLSFFTFCAATSRGCWLNWLSAAPSRG